MVSEVLCSGALRICLTGPLVICSNQRHSLLLRGCLVSAASQLRRSPHALPAGVADREERHPTGLGALRIRPVYVHCGTANLFCAVESRAGWHFVKASAHRKAPDFAEALKDVAAHSPRARRIHLVLDNRNIHSRFSLMRHFGWGEGLRLWKRFCVHDTPVHGSWLNQAEVEVSRSEGLPRAASPPQPRDREAVRAPGYPGPLSIPPGVEPPAQAVRPRRHAPFD
ncbi:hypothetical protein D7V97_11855 [Corallococcus sp. CA053C]|uniref:transposase n=1 Tax=Corallococcus sp. CA053C TaxID=2316732 RepID=UPI000EA356C8|nr:hypothetical protein D7V97_11855 [Corallococcus sp. CA053C]